MKWKPDIESWPRILTSTSGSCGSQTNNDRCKHLFNASRNIVPNGSHTVSNTHCAKKRNSAVLDLHNHPIVAQRNNENMRKPTPSISVAITASVLVHLLDNSRKISLNVASSFIGSLQSLKIRGVSHQHNLPSQMASNVSSWVQIFRTKWSQKAASFLVTILAWWRHFTLSLTSLRRHNLRRPHSVRYVSSSYSCQPIALRQWGVWTSLLSISDHFSAVTLFLLKILIIQERTKMSDSGSSQGGYAKRKHNTDGWMA